MTENTKPRAYQINIEDCFVTYLQRKFGMKPDDVDHSSIRRVCEAVAGTTTMDKIDETVTNRYVELIPGDVNVQHFEMEGPTTIERIMQYAKSDDWIKLIAQDTAHQIHVATDSIKMMPTNAYIFKDIGMVLPFLYCIGRLYSKHFTQMIPYEQRSYRMRVNWTPYMVNECYKNFKRHFDTVVAIFSKENVFYEFDRFYKSSSSYYDWRNTTILISPNIESDSHGRFMLFPSMSRHVPEDGQPDWHKFSLEYDGALKVYHHIVAGHKLMMDFFIRYMEDREWKYDSAKMLRCLSYATVDIFYYSYSDSAFEPVDDDDNEATITEFESIIDELYSGLN